MGKLKGMRGAQDACIDASSVGALELWSNSRELLGGDIVNEEHCSVFFGMGCFLCPLPLLPILAFLSHKRKESEKNTFLFWTFGFKPPLAAGKGGIRDGQDGRLEPCKS